MFFILSKLLFFFIQPFNWILFLFILHLVTKNKRVKKRFLIASIILFVMFSNSYLHNEIELARQVNENGIEVGKQYEVGILLGGMAGYDKNNVGHFSGAADRFIQTNILYHQGVIKKILITSGSANLVYKQLGEADFIVEELIKSGVPAKDILKENKSRDTYENATFSKHIIDSLHLKGPFVLISSAFHLPRAMKVFKKVGLQVIPYPSAFVAVKKIYSWQDYILPSLNVLMEWDGTIKEIIGTVVYKITGKA